MGGEGCGGNSPSWGQKSPRRGQSGRGEGDRSEGGLGVNPGTVRGLLRDRADRSSPRWWLRWEVFAQRGR